MFAEKKLRLLVSKLLFVTALMFGTLLCFSNGVAQTAGSKPRPTARLITTLSADDVNKTNSSGDNKTNHPNGSDSSKEKETTTNSSIPDEAIAKFVPSAFELKTLDLINKERQKYGFSQLVLDPEICLLARSYSETMAKKNFFSHIGPDGNDVQGRARIMGVKKWKAIGENLAFNQGYDDPFAFAVEKWMVSSSHRSNILLAMWTATGIGVAKSEDDSYYITQVFIAR